MDDGGFDSTRNAAAMDGLELCLLLLAFAFSLVIAFPASDASVLCQSDVHHYSRFVGYALFAVTIAMFTLIYRGKTYFRSTRRFFLNHPQLTMVLLPMLQATNLLFSNIFTFLEITSIAVMIYTGLFTLSLLKFERRINRAYNLNLATTMMSITMAMAVSAYAGNHLSWEELFVVWLLAVLVSFVTERIPVPLSVGA